VRRENKEMELLMVKSEKKEELVVRKEALW
jgi:hypothetical protein